MGFDFNSISSDPLLYFLTHSTLFVLIVATVFFTFGLMFGWLTWARYKRQRTELLLENEANKDELAQLKRKLAEQMARAAVSAAPPPSAPASMRDVHGKPDPVLDSFLNTAAALLPQHASPSSSREGAPEAHGKDPAPPALQATKADVDPTVSLLQSLIVEGHHQEAPADTAQAVPEIPETIVIQEEPKPVVEEPEPKAEGSATAENSEAPASVTHADPSPEQAAAVSPDANGSEVRLLSDPHLGLIYSCRPSLADDLSHLKGVASVIEGRLHDLGVYTFKQIALWNDENIHEFSTLLSFKDRIRREQWVDQARELHFQKYGERL